MTVAFSSSSSSTTTSTLEGLPADGGAPISTCFPTPTSPGAPHRRRRATPRNSRRHARPRDWNSPSARSPRRRTPPSRARSALAQRGVHNLDARRTRSLPSLIEPSVSRKLKFPCMRASLSTTPTSPLPHLTPTNLAPSHPRWSVRALLRAHGSFVVVRDEIPDAPRTPPETSERGSGYAYFSSVARTNARASRAAASASARNVADDRIRVSGTARDGWRDGSSFSSRPARERSTPAPFRSSTLVPRLSRSAARSASVTAVTSSNARVRCSIRRHCSVCHSSCLAICSSSFARNAHGSASGSRCQSKTTPMRGGRRGAAGALDERGDGAMAGFGGRGRARTRFGRGPEICIG